MEELYKLLQESLNERLYQITAGGPRKKDGAVRLKLRPVMIKDELCFQLECYRGNQVFHRNVSAAEAMEEMGKAMEDSFRQLDVKTMDFQAVALVSKKGKITIKKKKSGGEKAKELSLSHNRAKKYILEEGKQVPFLVDLGVQTQDGRIVKSRYDKFRQINRFLEFIADIMPILPKDRCVRIIDFGCGKSYLTFALYYYLKIVKNRDVQIVGLDLKEDVIMFCSKTAKELGYDELRFMTGDIADYESDGADMVVTLHACDTATDFALINAVKWRSRVILSVPCCQHELFSQIKNPVSQPMLKHGIIKDKFTELLTDGLRGLKLEAVGYDVSMIEFTSLEHTARNIMIKAVMPDRLNEASMKKACDEYEALKSFYNVSPTIDIL